MKRTRQILAITLLTAALCADRAIASSPVLRPQIAPWSRSGSDLSAAGSSSTTFTEYGGDKLNSPDTDEGGSTVRVQH